MRRDDVLLAMSSVFVLGGCAGIASLDDPIGRLPWTLAFLVPATIGWAAAMVAIRRAVAPSTGKHRFAIVLLTAAIARVLLIVPSVPLSDDLYRYLWDGRVANAGIHPFAHAPDATELAGLRDDVVWPRVNHPSVPTIYPPLAQLSFRVMDAASGDPRVPRLLAATLDLLTVILLAALLRRRGQDPVRALGYGWCPLAVLESAGGGHVDALGVPLMLGAFVAGTGTAVRTFVAGLLLGAATLVKPVAPLVVPALVVASPRARLPWLLGGGTVAMLFALPYLGAAGALFTGLRTYAEHWRFNDALYSVVVATGAAPNVIRVTLAAGAVMVAALVPLRVRDPVAAAAVAVGAALVLSPTVHPWYALWLAPLLPLAPRALARAGEVFVALLPVTYVAAWNLARTEEWVEPVWTRPLVWGLPGLVLLSAGVRRRRS